MLKRINFFILIGLLWGAPVMGFDLSHDDWTKVLQTFTQNSRVDYQRLKTNPQGLDRYLSQLDKVTQKEISLWPREDQLSFWINAYNAYTLKAIIDNYPIQSSFFKSTLYPKNSIRQIRGVWDKSTFPIAGWRLTLNEIEHEILRKEFNEPRIHMVLVCAALGCPPLRAEAYQGKALSAQLDDQSSAFLADPSQFRIEEIKDTVYLSSLFDWFGDDFILAYGTNSEFLNQPEKKRAILNFISRYLSPEDRKYLETASYKTRFLKYDWTLNEIDGKEK